MPVKDVLKNGIIQRSVKPKHKITIKINEQCIKEEFFFSTLSRFIKKYVKVDG